MKSKWVWDTFVPSVFAVIFIIFLCFVCTFQSIKIDKLEAERDNYKLLYELSDQPYNFKQ
jgi:hypothetical protein